MWLILNRDAHEDALNGTIALGVIAAVVAGHLQNYL